MIHENELEAVWKSIGRGAVDDSSLEEYLEVQTLTLSEIVEQYPFLARKTLQHCVHTGHTAMAMAFSRHRSDQRWVTYLQKVGFFKDEE